MAKVKFPGGGEVDMVTPDDLDKFAARIKKMFGPPLRVPVTATATVDGNGNIGALTDGVVLYEVPVGFNAQMLRLSLTSPSYTPASPLTQGYIYVVTNNSGEAPEAFFPGSGTTVLPGLYTDGKSAITLKQGNTLKITGSGLPTTGFEVRARLLMLLTPTDES